MRKEQIKENGCKMACPICSTNLTLPTKSPIVRGVIHKSFEDPAAAVGSEEERLRVFRRIRDEIKDWFLKTFEK